MRCYCCGRYDRNIAGTIGIDDCTVLVMVLIVIVRCDIIDMIVEVKIYIPQLGHGRSSSRRCCCYNRNRNSNKTRSRNRSRNRNRDRDRTRSRGVDVN